MFSFSKKVSPESNEAAVERVLTRGVAEVIDCSKLKEELLSEKKLRIKLGIDPTSPHIHIGRAVLLLKLKAFQELGHQIVLIIGDATGVVGDTSDKESERPMLSQEVIKENLKTYFDQAGRILDMKKVEKLCNSSWLDKLTLKEINNLADQFSLSDFIARENIKRRIDQGKRISLREVLYPLMQGYDSVAVEADVELGGTDQRFNLLAGRVLQTYMGQKPQHILMTNLIAGLDGRKMSSSWGNTINIIDAPEEMYGKIMSLSDNLIIPYFVHCTTVPMEEIRRLEKSLDQGSNPKDVKMHLAREIVALYYDVQKAERAERHFVQVFSERGVPDDIQTIHAAEGSKFEDVLVERGVVSSKSAWRRLVSEGAVSFPEKKSKKVTESSAEVAEGIIKIGKRIFVKIVLK